MQHMRSEVMKKELLAIIYITCALYRTTIYQLFETMKTTFRY